MRLFVALRWHVLIAIMGTIDHSSCPVKRHQAWHGIAYLFLTHDPDMCLCVYALH